MGTSLGDSKILRIWQIKSNENNAYLICFLASTAMATFYLEQMILNFKILIRKLIVH